jgi:hypothetical protein
VLAVDLFELSQSPQLGRAEVPQLLPATPQLSADLFYLLPERSCRWLELNGSLTEELQGARCTGTVARLPFAAK